MMLNGSKKEHGFTFIELLVVITIVGIIFAAGVVAYGAITVRSRNARRQADLEAIRQSLEMCRSLTGTYPASIYDSIACGANTLMTNTPKDPRGVTADCLDDSYNYAPDVTFTSYTLTAECAEPVGTTYVVTNP